MDQSRSFRAPLALFLLTALLSQAACMQTRMRIRDTGSSDSYSSSSSAPSVGDSAAAAAANSYVIDELKAEIARLSGRIEELERSKSSAAAASKNENDGLIQSLEKRIIELEKTQLEVLERLRGQHSGSHASSSGSPSGSVDAATSSSASSSIFERGRAAHAAGKFDDAIELLGSYLSQNPKGKHVEEALFLKAESQFLIKQYKPAIVDFSKISEKFPKSKRIPLVLLKIGQSFEALGMAEDARSFYQDLVERFPKSSEAKKAKSRIKG